MLQTLRFIAQHPLNRGRRLRALARFFRWQVGIRLVPGPVAVPFVNGARLLVGRGMTGATGNLYCGLHEFEEMAFLLHFLRAGEHFVDVGANVGSYTILASAGLRCRVTAFEPIPETFRHLEANVRLNDVGHLVRARNAGVGALAGTMRFVADADTVNRVAAPGDSARRQESVPVTTLDAELSGDPPVAIKVDTEGFEAAVIAGARHTLDNGRVRALVLELNGAGERYAFDEGAVTQELRARGFAECRYRASSRELVAMPGAKLPSGNVLFVRHAGDASRRAREGAEFEIPQ